MVGSIALVYQQSSTCTKRTPLLSICRGPYSVPHFSVDPEELRITALSTEILGNAEFLSSFRLWEHDKSKGDLAHIGRKKWAHVALSATKK